MSNPNERNMAIIQEFRANGGKVGGPFEGATLLLLTTTGAKSGQPRLSPLAYLTIDDKMIVIGGVIPAKDVPTLKEIGITGVFPGGTPFSEIVDFLRSHAKKD